MPPHRKNALQRVYSCLSLTRTDIIRTRTPMAEQSLNNHAEFIWSIADLLRGDYKQSEYGKVILPLTVLRRMDCVSEIDKHELLAEAKQFEDMGLDAHRILMDKRQQDFVNTNPLTFATLLNDPGQLAGNLRAYIASFDPETLEVIEKFNFDEQIARLDDSNLLYQVVARFADIDLHPDTVSNIEMGYIYEELIRRFSELSNETAGEHFTPREVIQLMVRILFAEDQDELRKPGVIKTLYDPACGTGGMLSVSQDYLRELNEDAILHVFGQEINAETFATCRADMLIKGQGASRITHGDSFGDDQHTSEKFDYCLANPPFGVEWKKYQDSIKTEHKTKGFDGRFGAGLPRISDGSFLFLQHMISKMKQTYAGGSRIAIVFNGSPLFSGGAGSGESEIRRWIIENDWLEAVVALPDQLFYNTGIFTYFWVITNRKSEQRRGKVQLIDARNYSVPMRKSLGDKRKMISDDQIAQITRLYTDFAENEQVKIFRNEKFGNMRITVERPLRARWSIKTMKNALISGQDNGKVDDKSRDELLAIAGDAEFETETKFKKFVRDVATSVNTRAINTATRLAMIRDDTFDIVTDSRGHPKPDPELRDYENVPLPDDLAIFWNQDVTSRLKKPIYRHAVNEYLDDEVSPHVKGAWIDHTKTKIGYEVPLTRHFYKYTPPRPLSQIDAEIDTIGAEIDALMQALSA